MERRSRRGSLLALARGAAAGPAQRKGVLGWSAAALLGAGLCLARAGAVDVKGTVRSDESAKQSSVQAVRPPYWQEWNGFIEPRKASVDYAREVSVVLVGPES